MQITYKPTGNTIYFTGNDSIDDTKGIIDEDKPIKLVVLDELTEFVKRPQVGAKGLVYVKYNEDGTLKS